MNTACEAVETHDVTPPVHRVAAWHVWRAALITDLDAGMSKPYRLISRAENGRLHLSVIKIRWRRQASDVPCCGGCSIDVEYLHGVPRMQRA